MSRMTRYTIKAVGLLVVLLCLAFIVQQLLQLDLQRIPPEQWIDLAGLVVVGGFIYGLVSFTLSLAWQRLLLWSGEARAPAGLCHGIYGRAQLAKYLPGNVFSIAGRHFLGHRGGFSNRALLWAAALEIFGMAFISGLLFALGGAELGEEQQLVEVPLLVIALTLPLVLPFVIPWIVERLVQRLPKLKGYGLQHRSFAAYLRLYGIFLLYLPFFLCGAALLWWLIEEVSGGLAPPFLLVLSISAGAWLVGFVTPGASGGIGVRDALLILALKPFVGEAIVFAALAFRLVTILGDSVFFLVALVFPLEPASISNSARDPSPPS